MIILVIIICYTIINMASKGDNKLVYIGLITILLIVVYNMISNCDERYISPTKHTVWTYWEPSPPPELVQKCYKNWRTKGKIQDMRFLNPDNILEYIPAKEYEKICKNSENPAVKSDFIGFYLLNKYGGTWIDGSIFLNKPLFDWLPVDSKKFFCYQADRFSKDVVCMETFFMFSPKDHPLPIKWYKLLHETVEGVGKDQFVKDVKKEHPDITDRMADENYLWVYVAGKKLLHDNPKFKELIQTESAEKGPWYEMERNGWENVDQICAALAKDEPCETCPLTKLHNGLRETCGLEVIPDEEE